MEKRVKEEGGEERSTEALVFSASSLSSREERIDVALCKGTARDGRGTGTEPKATGDDGGREEVEREGDDGERDDVDTSAGVEEEKEGRGVGSVWK